MKKLIILEYFTSQSVCDVKNNQGIFKEALNISNSIIKNFIKSDKIKNIIVIRNEILKCIYYKKVTYYRTNKDVSFLDILKTFKSDNEIILIAPESQKIYIKILKELNKILKVIGSSFKNIEIFSSKIKTIKMLKKYKIPVVNEISSNEFGEKIKLIKKPEYGAGSEKVSLIYNENISIEKKFVLQKFYAGKKGSFLMLCKNGENKVICCNQQIIRIKKNKVYQIGCIMGGLEHYRDEIELLADQISKKFSELFGVIGVDIVQHKGKWLVVEVNSRFTSSYCGMNNSYNFETINAITNFYINKNLKKFSPKLLKKYKYIF